MLFLKSIQISINIDRNLFYPDYKFKPILIFSSYLIIILVWKVLNLVFKLV